MQVINETYLGDGLYASCDGYRVEVFAHNGVGKTNAVYFEPEVITAFLGFLKPIIDAESGLKGYNAKSQDTRNR